jgi:hypothetical protein
VPIAGLALYGVKVSALTLGKASLVMPPRGMTRDAFFSFSAEAVFL